MVGACTREQEQRCQNVVAGIPQIAWKDATDTNNPIVSLLQTRYSLSLTGEAFPTIDSPVA